MKEEVSGTNYQITGVLTSLAEIKHIPTGALGCWTQSICLLLLISDTTHACMCTHTHKTTQTSINSLLKAREIWAIALTQTNPRIDFSDNFVFQLTPQQSIVAVYTPWVLIAQGGVKITRCVKTGYTLEGCSVTYWPVHPFPSAAILDFSVITASLGNLCHRPPPSNKQLPLGWGCRCWRLRLWKVVDKGCRLCNKQTESCAHLLSKQEGK